MELFELNVSVEKLQIHDDINNTLIKNKKYNWVLNTRLLRNINLDMFYLDWIKKKFEIIKISLTDNKDRVILNENQILNSSSINEFSGKLTEFIDNYNIQTIVTKGKCWIEVELINGIYQVKQPKPGKAIIHTLKK